MAKAKTKRSAPNTSLKMGVYIAASLERINLDALRKSRGYEGDYVLTKLYVKDDILYGNAGFGDVYVCRVDEVGEFIDFLTQIAEGAKAKS